MTLKECWRNHFGRPVSRKYKSDESKCLIIVESPLQLLCANEAIRYFSCQYELYLRISGNERNDEQLINTAQLLNLEYKLFILNAEKSRLSDLASYGAFIIRKSVISRYRKIFLGSYFSKNLRMIAKIFEIRGTPIVYLDDGMATLLAQKLMHINGRASTLFTFFQVCAQDNQVVIKHSFDFLKASFPGEKKLMGTYFVGQKLIEVGLCEDSDYFRVIQKAAHRHPEGLTYVPHRGENAHTISTIANIRNVKILDCDVCLELYFLKNNIEPRIVYACSSTALFTLPKLFNKTQLYWIDCTKIYTKAVPHLNEINNAIRCHDRILKVDVLAHEN